MSATGWPGLGSNDFDRTTTSFEPVPFSIVAQESVKDDGLNFENLLGGALRGLSSRLAFDGSSSAC